MTPGTDRPSGAVDVSPAVPAVVTLLQSAVERRLGQCVDVRVEAEVRGRRHHLMSTLGAAAPDVRWPRGCTPGPRVVVAQHGTTGVLTSVAVRTHDAVDWSGVTGDVGAAAVVLAGMVADRVALADLRQDIADLTASMRSREVIDQALGVVMARRCCPPDRALEILRVTSQHRNEKISALAARVVASTGGAQPEGSRPFVPRRHT
ncbi:ANTAR domain-containing protein [Cellulomonas xiejunii]|uniref:ANTAR domain-containing protein n=1 Tax=Cellulomonas xiejunii TaxID=2968083 RepID=A0ABY5KTL5_9CELL|nr:ANTAR domain-containing protein [Cellulomonas xiejunii]MCC2313926.1 ANTAR domain-containing protein [Cellulomonas xiejunii]MCC2322429.1 ANTAR domain-containing protein [Cellulomonas xiejunii]UUI72475.1 ANTAR domain-containing protein [Cellulomonas xiejunii]